jgi:tetratricopeptide (TPR) repeat protein
MKRTLGIMALVAALALSPIVVWAQQRGGGGNKGGQGQGGGRGNASGQGQGNPGRGNAGQGNQGGRGQQSFRPALPPTVEGRARVDGDRGNAGASAQFNRPGNQAIYQNQIRIGQRPYDVAPKNYRPSYQNYAWHNGYWNNSYGWNPQIGYGRGYWGPGSYGNYGGYGIRIGNVTIGLGGNAGYRNYGGYGYGRYPMGWGYGGWGLGNTLYRSGYASYYNPYWIDNGGTSYAYNYAQPVYVTGSESISPTTPTTSTNSLVDEAVEAFKAGDYQATLTQLDQAIKSNPKDAVLHELRALTLFAMRNYSEAAATIHSVLAVGPGWDWPTMASLYPDVNRYTEQLRELEGFTKKNSDDAGGRLLLGYHYLTLGHPESAAKEFSEVVRLQPKDRVAQELVNLVAKPKDGEQPEAIPPPDEKDVESDAKPEEPPPTSIKAESLAGNWTATRDDGSKFKLDLNADKTYTWHFEQGTRHEEFKGTYSVEGSLLVLQRNDGGAMVAHVAPEGDGKFTFKVLGAPKDDPGLAFNR